MNNQQACGELLKAIERSRTISQIEQIFSLCNSMPSLRNSVFRFFTCECSE
jgi:hypothetical protein